jgi:hypothetical protein
VSLDPTHICECIIAVHTSCDSRTAIVFVGEGSERVKTATLSFKLKLVMSLVIATSASFAKKRTLTKGGEYDYQHFGYNQLHSGGTVTASLCTCVCFLWRTTLYYDAHIFERWKQCNYTTIIADDIQVPYLNLSILSPQHADTMIPMYEIMQTPLSCYGNLLHVKERLAIYYSLLKRSLRFSYGQQDIEWGSPTALHVIRMNVKRKADIEHSPAMIEVMIRIKYAFG